jgi:hypothetical protein
MVTHPTARDLADAACWELYAAYLDELPGADPDGGDRRRLRGWAARARGETNADAD